MPYEIEITETAPQTIAAVKVHTTLRKIAEDIPAGFGAVVSAMGSAGLAPSGAPLLVYHDVIDEETDGDVEICVPVTGEIDGDSEVYTRELEGGTMAVTTHQGPYNEIAPAYHTLTSWISEHGHEMAGPPREIYLNDPQTVPEDELLTRVEWPIH